jgi:hypothetical protein
MLPSTNILLSLSLCICCSLYHVLFSSPLACFLSPFSAHSQFLDHLSKKSNHPQWLKTTFRWQPACGGILAAKAVKLRASSLASCKCFIPHYSKCGPLTSSISNTRELVRNALSQSLLGTTDWKNPQCHLNPCVVDMYHKVRGHMAWSTAWHTVLPHNC